MPERVNRHDYLPSEKPVESKFAVEHCRKALTTAKASGLEYAAQKTARGSRAARQSLAYLVMLEQTFGDDWLTPDLFRFGASTLANDVLMQIAKVVDGK